VDRSSLKVAAPACLAFPVLLFLSCFSCPAFPPAFPVLDQPTKNSDRGRDRSRLTPQCLHSLEKFYNKSG
jgi:hypothetical protein